LANIKPALFFSGLLLILVLLAACQGPAPVPTVTTAPALTPTDPPPATQTDVPAPVVTQEPESTLGVLPEELRQVTVSFWYTGSEGEAAALRELAMTFNASNAWGLWVDPVFVGSFGEISDRVAAGLETADLPEIVLDYPEIALGWEREQKIIADLTPYVQDPVWGMSAAEQEDYYPAFWQAAEIDGRRIGLPAPHSANVLFYNRGWAQELGFNRAPTTPDEFKEQACAAAQANQGDEAWDNNGTGGWAVRSDALTAQSWIGAFGGQVSPDGGQTYSLNTAEARSAFEFLKSLVEQGCAWVGREPESFGYLANRFALFTTGSPADAAAQENAAGSSQLQDQWSLIPFPSVDGRPVMVSEGPHYMLVQKTPVKQLAAWLFIRWLSQPENQARLIRASGLLPARASVASQLADYRSQHPQWAEALLWLPDTRTGPRLPSWVTVRPVLADAAFQLFNPNAKPEPVAETLARLEQTAAELLGRQP